MCGIAGAWGRFESDLVPRMIRRLAHRGPDDEGIYRPSRQFLTLGHRRLAILDRSPAGRQPMVDPSTGTCIVFNGEIYNHPEWRERLEKDGARFQGRSDTEVLLALYRAYGPGMLDLLEGMFAFALWDPRREELLLARDGFGVKPLYFTETPKGFLFASEIKALLEEPSVNRAPDPVALAQYLTYLWCPSPRTPFRDIRKLEPGKALLLRDAGIRESWTFYAPPVHAPRSGAPPSEIAGRVRQTLDQAVHRQMISDVPVGAFLSGGLDSSAIVALARTHTPDRLRCFSIELPAEDASAEGIIDDLPYARRAAAHLGVELHTLSARFNLANELDLMIRTLEEPQADPAALHVYFISSIARRCGVPVLLSGAGGDDLFTGYRRHEALAAERLWSWMPRPFRRSLQTAVALLPAKGLLSRRIRRALGNAGAKDHLRLLTYFEWCPADLAAGLLHPDLAPDVTPEAIRAPLQTFLDGLPDASTPLDRMLALERRFFLADHNLLYTDKMAMAHGIEVRVPFLDRDVAALAASLPDSCKIRRGVTKWILRKAFENDLPREILRRPKTGFGVPLRQWLRGPLRVPLDELLHPDTLRRRRIFNPQAVSRLVSADRTGQIDAAYTILSVLCIDLWWRRFVDGGP
ncbi:MAG TPA: asparagine synthase (glutamine-hydrolyzing) [Planctomycetota bacterium]|nr:asparagine synthase (glutamine-hydrolyzing) [Planctomycetota bacterium]